MDRQDLYKVTQQIIDEDNGIVIGFKTLGTYTNFEQAERTAKKAKRTRNIMTEGRVFINGIEW